MSSFVAVANVLHFLFLGVFLVDAVDNRLYAVLLGRFLEIPLGPRHLLVRAELIVLHGGCFGHDVQVLKTWLNHPVAIERAVFGDSTDFLLIDDQGEADGLAPPLSCTEQCSNLCN